MDFSAGAAVEVISDLNALSAGEQFVTAEFAHTTTQNKAYFLKADKSSGSHIKVKAVQFSYNTPDSQATI